MYQKIVEFISNPKVQVIAAVAAILTFASGFRFYGLDWGQDNFLHPDSYAIIRTAQNVHLPDWPLSLGQLLDAENSPLNPHNFAYGSFYIYLLKGIGSFISNFTEGQALKDLHLAFVGRGMSAFFDTGTVLLIYLLGRRLYNHRIGLLAAVFAAFTVLSIQQAHLCTVDSMLTFFITLTVLVSALLVNQQFKHNIWIAVPIGICMGLAIATKLAAAALLAVVVTFFVLRCFKKGAEVEEDNIDKSSFRKGHILRNLSGLAVAVVVAIITIALTEPYVFIDWDSFMRDTQFNRDVVITGNMELPWSQQFISTVPFIYQVKHLSIWGMGLPLAISCWAGFVFTIIIMFWKRRKREILLLSWMVPYLIVVCTMEVKFVRYMLPLVPFFCILAAYLFAELHGWAKGKWRIAVIGVAAFVVISSIFYSFAYVGIYTKPHPLVQAANWANTNIERDEVVIIEEWEWTTYLGPYKKEIIHVYATDTPDKIDIIAGNLSNADYIFLATNRAYAAISRLPERYPYTSRYYEQLFSGELGFELAYCSTLYPSFAGITIIDDTFSRGNLPVPEGIKECSPSGAVINLGYADETFTVFDHPKSMIFRKNRDLTQQEIYDLLIGDTDT